MKTTDGTPVPPHTPAGMERRTFLKGASVLGGALVTSGFVGAPEPVSVTGLRPRGAQSREITPTERRVLDLIQPDEVASVLQDIVRIPTAMSTSRPEPSTSPVGCASGESRTR